MAQIKKPLGLLPVFACYVAAALFLLPWHGAGLTQEQSAPVEPDRTRIADYDIQVRLDNDTRTLAGSETIAWTNVDGPPVNELKLHLYMNAFRSPDTRFFEQGYEWREEDAGWIDITDIGLATGANLMGSMSIDETVMTVRLPAPVNAGETLRLDIDFTVRLPRAVARTGYAGSYYFVAQWFPKLGVYLDGRWICPQYHSFTEFFADFGRYRVEITVPRDFEVDATGVRERARTEGETKTLVYSAWPVHDFAWTASPHFRRVKRDLEYTVGGENRKLELHLLMQRDRMELAPDYEEAVRRSLTTFAADYGEFPYPKLVVVDPASGRGLNTGGMEYPMIITGGSTWLDTALFPGDEPVAGVTAHEFAHQYWYAAVATNEFHEAWIDEGLTTFTSNAVIDTFGPFDRENRFFKILSDSFVGLHPFRWDFAFRFDTLRPLLTLGLRTDTLAGSRRDYLELASIDPINTEALRPYNGTAYNVSAYSKPDLALRTLERIIGRQTLRRALARFYTEFRFRHPTGADFRRIVAEVAERDLNWFFSQVFDSTGILDYAVTGISADNEITIERLGAVNVPQRITVTLTDGRTISFDWGSFTNRGRIWMDEYIGLEGHEGVEYRLREGAEGRWLKIALSAGADVASAAVDPDLIYLLDINLANNSYRVLADRDLADRAEMGWIRILARWLHGVSVYN